MRAQMGGVACEEEKSRAQFMSLDSSTLLCIMTRCHTWAALYGRAYITCYSTDWEKSGNLHTSAVT